MRKMLFLALVLLVIHLQVGTARDINLVHSNKLQYGVNPFTDVLMDFENGQVYNQLPIFDFDVVAVDSNDGCETLTNYQPEVNTYCYNDTWSQNFYVDSVSDLLQFVSYPDFDQITEDEPQSMIIRYGAYNPWVQDLYQGLMQGRRFKARLLVHELVNFELPTGWSTLSCHFVEDVKNLDPTSYNDYTQFIQRYGIYYRSEIWMGGSYMIIDWLDNADEMTFNDIGNNGFYGYTCENDCDYFTFGGNPQLIERYNLYNGWSQSSLDHMSINWEYFGRIEGLLNAPEFSNFPNINTIREKLTQSIDNYIADTGILWSDTTISANDDPENFLVSVAFESGLTLHSDGPALFSNNNERIVDIALTSKWVSFLNIQHFNPAHDYFKGTSEEQTEFGGSKDWLNVSLSRVISIAAIDNFGGHTDCEEIKFYVNGNWYDSCSINLFNDGIRQFKIYDRSGW